MRIRSQSGPANDRRVLLVDFTEFRRASVPFVRVAEGVESGSGVRERLFFQHWRARLVERIAS